ncbi:hypothetical protein [Spirillospora sp. NPDC029432]
MVVSAWKVVRVVVVPARARQDAVWGRAQAHGKLTARRSDPAGAAKQIL